MSIQEDSTKEVYYSTGRGGAGNIARGSPSPQPREGRPGEETPHLNAEYYTTGRGGHGNIRHNENKKEARIAQDVDEQDHFSFAAAPSTSNSSIGRGGYGNLRAARHQESLIDKAKKLFKS
jgi:hypothetical protein